MGVRNEHLQKCNNGSRNGCTCKSDFKEWRQARNVPDQISCNHSLYGGSNRRKKEKEPQVKSDFEPLSYLCSVLRGSVWPVLRQYPGCSQRHRGCCHC